MKLCDDKKIHLNMVFRANMQTSLYHRLWSLSHNPNECFYFGKLKREIRQNASFGEESHIIMKPPGKLNTVLMIQGVVFVHFQAVKNDHFSLEKGKCLSKIQNSWVVKRTGLCSSVFTY